MKKEQFLLLVVALILVVAIFLRFDQLIKILGNLMNQHRLLPKLLIKKI